MPTTPLNGADPQLQESSAQVRAVWSLLILVLVLVVLLVGAGLAYVTWRHPSLATPLEVAVVSVTLLVTAALALARR
ncbi:hypothetical protein ABZ445_25475 [Streptomyces chartreusis]|uniref:hypothetical protein n=1 Tax=Streptomyces chartreusis TaxID=1969 RepID=UPI0033ECE407